MRRVSLVALLLCLLVSACSRQNDVETAAQIRTLLNSPPAFAPDNERTVQTWHDVAGFYEAVAFRPAWIRDRRLSANTGHLFAALQDARTHGLDPDGYGYPRLMAARDEAARRWFGETVDNDAVAPLDVEFTFAFMRFARDLREGRVSPRRVIPEWVPVPEPDDLADHLATALSSGRVRETLSALAPAHAQYAALRVALA